MKRTVTTKKATRRTARETAKFKQMAEEATTDCYNEYEQAMGWFNMIEENLELPFKTTVLGVEVSVDGIVIDNGDQLVAICARGRAKQSISLLELPAPSSSPDGYEWLEAYRYWGRGQV